MIPIDELLFVIDTKINSLSVLKGKYIPDETKIEVLNLSQLKLVLKKTGVNNNYQSGIDSYARRYEDLQVLQVPFEQLEVMSVDSVQNSYISPISGLSKKMIIPIGGYISASKGNCKNRTLDIKEFVKHAEIRLKLESSHYKPSFEYQETLASLSNNSIYVYGQSDFVINNLFLSYLRYPIQMDVAGYEHLDSTPSTNENCELDYYLMNELVDITVEEIADSLGNQNQSQLSRQRVKEIE